MLFIISPFQPHLSLLKRGLLEIPSESGLATRGTNHVLKGLELKALTPDLQEGEGAGG